jgi:hypothetical protein
MSIEMASSAIALNTVAATPGRSGTRSSVTLASAASSATPEISTPSIGSSTSWTQVPGPSSNDDRTCKRTPARRAYSTDLDCSTWAPAAASSSISS